MHPITASCSWPACHLHRQFPQPSEVSRAISCRVQKYVAMLCRRFDDFCFREGAYTVAEDEAGLLGLGSEQIAKYFPSLHSRKGVHITGSPQNGRTKSPPLILGIVLSGGQAPGKIPQKESGLYCGTFSRTQISTETTCRQAIGCGCPAVDNIMLCFDSKRRELHGLL